MPELLQEKNWECAAAAELTEWTKMFLKGKHPQSELPELSEEGGTELLQKVANVRHTAVHRLPTTAKDVCRLLESAVTFAQVLRDDRRAEQLDGLRAELSSKIKAMELNKKVLGDKLASELQAIQKRREELDKREAELIQKTLNDDMDNKILIGQLLEGSVHQIFKNHSGDGQGESGDDEKEDSRTEDGRKEEGEREVADPAQKVDTRAGEENREEGGSAESDVEEGGETTYNEG